MPMRFNLMNLTCLLDDRSFSLSVLLPEACSSSVQITAKVDETLIIT